MKFNSCVYGLGEACGSWSGGKLHEYMPSQMVKQCIYIYLYNIACYGPEVFVLPSCQCFLKLLQWWCFNSLNGRPCGEMGNELACARRACRCCATGSVCQTVSGGGCKVFTGSKRCRECSKATMWGFSSPSGSPATPTPGPMQALVGSLAQPT